MSFLLGKRNELAPWETLVELALADDEGTAPSGVLHHFSLLVNAIALELWRGEIFHREKCTRRCFVSTAEGSLSGGPDTGHCRDNRALWSSSPRSRGLPIALFRHPWCRSCHFRSTHPSIRATGSRGCSRTPRGHAWWALSVHRGRTRGARHSAEVDQELIAHWIRSRPIAWTSKNPLAAVRVRSFPGEYYENQRMLTDTIEFAAGAVCLMAALQRRATDDAFSMFSSRLMNNWETLDIDHYLVLFPRPGGRKLAGDCVPFRAERETLVDLCELALDIDPRQWRSRRGLAGRITQAVSRVQRGYFKKALTSTDQGVEARVYRKFAPLCASFDDRFGRDPPGRQK